MTHDLPGTQGSWKSALRKRQVVAGVREKPEAEASFVGGGFLLCYQEQSCEPKQREELPALAKRPSREPSAQPW